MAIKILNNEVNSFSIFLNRDILIEIDTVKILLEIQIILFRDDEKNFKIDVEVAQWCHVIFNNTKIAGYDNIKEFKTNYNYLAKTDISNSVNSYINDMYKNYNNTQIINMFSEHNII